MLFVGLPFTIVMSQPPPTFTRRRWLSTAGLLTASVGISAKAWQSERFPSEDELNDWARQANEQLATYFPEQERTTDLVPPREPSAPPRRRTAPPPLDEPPGASSDYAKFIAKFDFRYIKPREVIQPHRRVRNGVSNTLPPARLWANMPETLRVADEIRHRLGTPLDYITSAYRCPSYNRQCGGASQSLHMRNNALDLVYASGPDAAFAIAKELREEGFFRGGIGLYRSFIHIDTRGYNASWTS